MTQEKIKEGNKLIAEFMGYQYEIGAGTQPYGWYHLVEPKIKLTEFNEPYREYLCREDSDMKYHSSWDWLMPVIKKVFESLVGNVEDWTFLIEKRIRDSVLEINIEQTWMYVVEFAKKHNKK